MRKPRGRGKSSPSTGRILDRTDEIQLNDLRTGSPRTLIAATSLCWVVAAFALSSASGHLVPLALGKLVVFLLPLLWLGRIGDGRPLDRDAARWVVIAGIGLAWLALVQVCNPHSIESGWWRWSGRCLALAAALAVAASGIDVRRHMRWFGTSAAVVVTIALVVGVSEGTSNSQCFGLGNINILVNTAGPALCAWLVLSLVDWRLDRRPAWWELVVLTIGMVCQIVFIVDLHRRGAALAIAAICCWFCWRWAFRRWQRTTMIMSIMVIAAACIPAWRTLENDHAGNDDQRMMMYEAAVEGIVASPLWGYGELGSLRLPDFAGEHAAHLVAKGFKTANVHNEFLDAGLAGGIPAMCFLLALVALLALRTGRIRDSAIAAGLQAGGVAIALHLLTDNALSFEITMVYCGTFAGMILAAETTSGSCHPSWLPPMWALITPLALISWRNAASGWAIAVAHETSDQVVTAALESRDPEAVILCATLVLGSSDKAYAPFRAQVLQAAVRKVGWSDKLAFYAMKDAAAAGADEELVTATLRYLELKPFNVGAWKLLHQSLSRQPELSQDLPLRTLRRLSWLNNRPQAPQPILAPPTSLAEAGDVFASLHWCLAHGFARQELSSADDRLYQRYGDISAVAELHKLIGSLPP